MKDSKGFTACGQFYSMGESFDYIKYCKQLLQEIRDNAKKNKS